MPHFGIKKRPLLGWSFLRKNTVIIRIFAYAYKKLGEFNEFRSYAIGEKTRVSGVMCRRQVSYFNPNSLMITHQTQ